MNKTYINWSGGKDACLALFKFQKNNSQTVSKLVTTINSEDNSVSMHRIPLELVKKQAQSIQIPLHTIEIPGIVDTHTYNVIMKDHITQLENEGFSQCIYGDIFLEDLRIYREQQLKESKISALFPLWKITSEKLIYEFIDLGFKAIVVCVNSNLLNEDFCGRIIDKDFIKDLPDGIDPCGENGEFHTFVYDGPIFTDPVEFGIGLKYQVNLPGENSQSWDTNFTYCNLLPK